MSTQSSAGRRAAAIAAAAKLGPASDDLEAAIAQHRAGYEVKRAKREPVNRRKDERRVGPFDRREHESQDRRSGDRRKFATMADKLAAESHKHDGERKYSGGPLSDFGLTP